MQVGTIETTVEEKKKRKRRPTFSGGGSNNGDKNRGGGGGGNDDNGKNNRNPLDHPGFKQYMPDTSRVVMWFLLIVVFMTFSGLMGSYIYIASTGVTEWKPFELPFQIFVSTTIIVVSSFTYIFAEKALKANDQNKAKNWLIATTVLGAAFIASQILSWMQLSMRGVYLESNPYAGFYYILTILHALHVLGGIGGLGAIVLKTWIPATSEEFIKKRNNTAKIVGWYWHFMGGLWFVLFLLLGFFK